MPESTSAEIEPASREKPFMLRRPLWGVFIVFVLLLGAFIGQNLEPTSVDFLFWSLLDAPKIVLLLLGIPVGAIGWELLRRALFRR